MPHTVKKNIFKNPWEACKSLETKFKFHFRPVNALDFFNFFKMDLLKIPDVEFSLDKYNLVDCI